MIKKSLELLKDEKYQNFSSSLLPGIDNIIGVRLPILRKLSKHITLEELSDDTFEEIMLQAMVIGREKNFVSSKDMILSFLPKINNWSICDSFASSLKIAKANKKEMFSLLRSLKNSELVYTRRFVLVMLINYFLDDNLEEVTSIAREIKKDDYYVKMAYCWFIAEVFYKNDGLARKLIEEEKDEFIVKKSLAKIKESRKISKKENVL